MCSDFWWKSGVFGQIFFAKIQKSGFFGQMLFFDSSKIGTIEENFGIAYLEWKRILSFKLVGEIERIHIFLQMTD